MHRTTGLWILATLALFFAIDRSAAAAITRDSSVLFLADSRDAEAWTIPLDDTGFASWEVLSPREPLEILPDKVCKVHLVFANETVDRTFFLEIEKVPAAKLKETDPAKKVTKPYKEQHEGFAVKCDETGGTCALGASISAGGHARLPAAVLAPECDCSAPVPQECSVPETLYNFKARFFDDDATPANPNAYVYLSEVDHSTDKKPPEPDGAFNWKLTAKVGYSQDFDPLRYTEDDAMADAASALLTPPGPKIIPAGKKVGDTRPFTQELPFEGKVRKHFTGSGTLTATANMGARADALVDVGFKSGDLGAADQSGDAKASQYWLNAYGLRHWRLRFGKTTFLAPTSGAAIFLKGEGFQVIKRDVRVGYLAQRESAGGVANREDLDRTIVFGQWDVFPRKRGIPIERRGGQAEDGTRGKRLRDTFSLRITDVKLYGLLGEEQATTSTLGPYDHRTLGAEAAFRIGRAGGGKCAQQFDQPDVDAVCRPWARKGSLAFYHSRRDGKALPENAPEGSRMATDGRGTVGVLDVGFHHLKVERAKTEKNGKVELGKVEVKSQRVVRLLLARGSGDDAGTADRNEGYIGETAVFGPDKIFLASLAGSISTGFTENDMPSSGGQVAGSLANIEYAGVTVTDNTFSLLEVLKEAVLRIKGDVDSRKTILRLHRYRFVEPVFGSRDAGEELSLEFEMVAPKGVSLSLGGAVFNRGDALAGVLRRNAKSIFFTVTISLKP